MKSNLIKSIFIWGGALCLWAAGQYLSIAIPDLTDLMLRQQGAIYSYVGLLVTGFWHTSNRLNSLDDLDDLKTHHRDAIRQKVKSIKVQLTRRITFLLLMGLIVFVLSVARSKFSIVATLLEQALLLLVSVLWLLTVTAPAIFQVAENIRHYVSALRRKERARRDLIAELRRDRQSEPL